MTREQILKQIEREAESVRFYWQEQGEASTVEVQLKLLAKALEHVNECNRLADMLSKGCPDNQPTNRYSGATIKPPL